VEILRESWEESYGRRENFIFYPKEEVVRFINRFVRKRVGVEEFRDIIDFRSKVRGLDFGCGIGRQAILMREFGIEAYGLDISETAIAEAKRLSVHFGYPEMADNFRASEGVEIPFPDGYFDVTVCEAVLDSMHFSTALEIMKEIDRVTKQIVFISVISGDDRDHYREFDGEEKVDTVHEQNTIQSYFNWTKIDRLIGQTGFTPVWSILSVQEGLWSPYRYGRYYVVLKRK
jgi:SAM-dependent methyltransferase